MGQRKRGLPFVFLGLGAALYVWLAPKWPREQRLHIVLGDRAARVEELRVRSGDVQVLKDPPRNDDWVREVTFRYARAHAPRIVSYEPRLADGEYLVEIEVKSDDARVSTTDRRVLLQGGTVSLDLSGEGAGLGVH